MNLMPKHPHLTKRGDVYWYRRKVPRDLQGHYAPKTHITFTLRTSDPKEALCRVRKEAVRLDEEFGSARQLQAAPVRPDLSDEDIQRLAALWFHEQLEADETARRKGLGAREAHAQVRDQVLSAGGRAGFPADEPAPSFGMNRREFSKTGQTLAFLLPLMREALARGDASVVTHEVDELLAVHGIKLDPASDAYHRLAYAILKTDVEAYTAMAKRQEGDPVPTPPEPLRPRLVPSILPQVMSVETRDITVSSLWSLYLRERKPPAKTASDFGTYLRRFMEVNGDLPLKSVTKAHVREFKDAMLRFPVRLGPELRKLPVPQVLERFAADSETPRLSPQTVNQKALAAVGAVFSYAVDNGYRDDNPAQGIRAAGEAKHGPARIPYSVADLKVIFSSRVYAQGEHPAGSGEATKWLPLLALFTGARLEELGSLDTADIGEERGIPFLFIHGDGEGRSIKTRSSRRRVPVHPELIRLGFLGYAAARKKAGDAKLFPHLKSRRAQRTAAFSTWWGRYTAKLGITDPKKVFHSFRHGVKRGLRDAGVDPTIRDAIMGHTARDVAERYGLDEEGFGFSLPSLLEGLSKLSYPGLDLSHLLPPQASAWPAFGLSLGP